MAEPPAPAGEPSSGARSFPRNYVTLRQLQEMRLKEKREAEAAAAASAAKEEAILPEKDDASPPAEILLSCDDRERRRAQQVNGGERRQGKVRKKTSWVKRDACAVGSKAAARASSKCSTQVEVPKICAKEEDSNARMPTGRNAGWECGNGSVPVLGLRMDVNMVSAKEESSNARMQCKAGTEFGNRRGVVESGIPALRAGPLRKNVQQRLGKMQIHDVKIAREDGSNVRMHTGKACVERVNGRTEDMGNVGKQVVVEVRSLSCRLPASTGSGSKMKADCSVSGNEKKETASAGSLRKNVQERLGKMQVHDVNNAREDGSNVRMHTGKACVSEVKADCSVSGNEKKETVSEVLTAPGASFFKTGEDADGESSRNVKRDGSEFRKQQVGEGISSNALDPVATAPPEKELQHSLPRGTRGGRRVSQRGLGRPRTVGGYREGLVWRKRFPGSDSVPIDANSNLD